MEADHLIRDLLVAPGSELKLSKWDPDGTAGFKDKSEALKILEKNQERLAELQYKLYAQGKYALLVVLQGMDASGKDGAIRHVMHGVNPQGCSVTAFKGPTPEEMDHDFLWRIHKAAPPRGSIGIFNRSHYEDVLIVRVHNLVPKSVWSKRYKQINEFERTLAQNDTVILKFFLHISKDEQKRRLEQRLEDPSKNWKMNPDDLKERALWNDYQRAYQEALSECNAIHAPWFVVPANRKWFRNLAISEIIIDTLEGLDMKYPKPSFDPKAIKVE